MEETRRVAIKRCVLLSSVIIIIIISIFGIGYLITDEEKPQPLNLTSITKDWFCKDGQALPISTSKIVAVCKDEYVDIRQVINHKATIKGIQLTLEEWKQLNDIINDVNDFL